MNNNTKWIFDEERDVYGDPHTDNAVIRVVTGFDSDGSFASGS